MDLYELCLEVNNFFEKSINKGTFTITDGKISPLNFLQADQYFRIKGSVFNDGVYKYKSETLKDETFEGEIWAMAVPPNFETLLKDIADWLGKYQKFQDSPFSSESLGGFYSYSKDTSSGGSGSGGGASKATWQGVFMNRLNKWRKL